MLAAIKEEYKFNHVWYKKFRLNASMTVYAIS